MIQLLDGEFGNGIYDCVDVVGDTRGRRIKMKAYLGFYADGHFRFSAVTSCDMTADQALRQVQDYQLAEGDTQRTRFLRRGDISSAEQLLWKMAAAKTQPFNLPLAFFLFATTPEDKKTVTFWCPELVPAEWMLEQMQHFAQNT